MFRPHGPVRHTTWTVLDSGSMLRIDHSETSPKHQMILFVGHISIKISLPRKANS